MATYRTISPGELAERLKRGDELQLIDVREPIEYRIAHIEGARLMPLSRFDEWAITVEPDQETVFICHHGIRSAQACAHFARQGFSRVLNLEGGIDLWSADVDPRVPRY